MKRREFIGLLGGMALSSPGRVALAQAERVYKLGIFMPGGAVPKPLIDKLAQLGYVVGQNLAIDARNADDDQAKVPQHFQDLQNNNVDAIVCIGYPLAMAAKASGIPTVLAFGVGDPIETGLITSLAHPGGNMTGISDVAATLALKRFALLKEVVPKMRRVAMLWNKDDPAMALRYDASAQVARSAGISVQPLGVGAMENFDDAFAAMKSEPPDAILMVTDRLTTINCKRVFDFAIERRLPGIYEYDFYVRDGGLMSYGPDLRESFERVAALVDRIFNGGKAGDLPFELPTRYLFVINLKTANLIGLEIPPTMLALADDVIE